MKIYKITEDYGYDREQLAYFNELRNIKSRLYD
jgi:hypothetical protein